MRIRKAAASISADIDGVDLADLDSTEFRDIYGAWLESSVLRFRDQELTKDELQGFSERFGPLEYAPICWSVWGRLCLYLYLSKRVSLMRK